MWKLRQQSTHVFMSSRFENKGSNYLHYTPSVVVNVMSWFLFQLNQLNPFDDVLLVSVIINALFFLCVKDISSLC